MFLSVRFPLPTARLGRSGLHWLCFSTSWLCWKISEGSVMWRGCCLRSTSTLGSFFFLADCTALRQISTRANS
ncbi:hypothetical protein FGO68_gene4014 [Halteria grandinella]|uniref:Uncharacterized protein n=1 Tax=Halteria grandinella TaxID=5974 RepID=A0A8J8P530_HALGN|nr:hypothetical protein FGO68_gene4014 [Halteria grandinella]